MRCPNHRPSREDGQELYAADVDGIVAQQIQDQRRTFAVFGVRGLVRIDQPDRGPRNRFELHDGELLAWQLGFVTADGTLYRGDIDRVTIGPGHVVCLPPPGPGERGLLSFPPGESSPPGAERLGTVTGNGFHVEAPAWTLDAAEEVASAWNRLRSTLSDYRRRHEAALKPDFRRQLDRVLRLRDDARVADALDALEELQAEAALVVPDTPGVRFPPRGAGAGDVFALFERMADLYQKDNAMDNRPLPEVSPPVPVPSRPPRPRRRAAVALVAAGLALISIACYFALPPSPGGPHRPPDVEGSASLGVTRLPVPGMLAEQNLAVATADHSRTDARLQWQLWVPGEPTPRHAGELPTDATAAALAAEVLPNFGLGMGNGVLRIAVGPAARPKWQEVRLGAVLPNGLTYVSSQRDPAGMWYTTACRQVDDALVSLTVSPDGKSLVGIDVGFVTVKAYLDHFKVSPTAAKHLLASARVCDRFPLAISRKPDEIDSVNNCEELAAVMGRPFLDGPRPAELARWRVWPVAPYLRERYAVPVEPLAGVSTDDWPVIGLSAYDAHAFALWVSEQSGEPWALAGKPFELPSTPVLTGPRTGKGEPGRLGLVWTTGNLWHFQTPVGGYAAAWGNDWRGVPAPSSLLAWQLHANASFRLAIVRPLVYEEIHQ